MKTEQAKKTIPKGEKKGDSKVKIMKEEIRIIKGE